MKRLRRRLTGRFSMGSAFRSICWMFLSFGNAFMFGGLLATLPEQERFDAFAKRLAEREPV